MKMPRQTGFIQFDIEGPLCFLSHQETVTMWQRVLVRAQVPLVWRGSFNPRPQMSLPFPRPVGVQAQGDLLLLGLAETAGEDALYSLRPSLDRQLPAGCRITEMQQFAEKISRHPGAVTYVLKRDIAVAVENWLPRLEQARSQLHESSPILRERRRPSGPVRQLDLREYILTMEGDCDSLEIGCRVDPAGTVRVDELLEWLHLSPLHLAEPVRRKAVQWECN